MWSSILFGVVLIGCSAILLFRNQAAWRFSQSEQHDEREHAFLYRQYRIRTQANVLMAIVGIAVIGGYWLTNTIMTAAYWMGVILIVCWMAVLAIVDLVSTRRYYGLLQQEQLAERALLEGELAEIRQRGGNGRPKNNPLEDLK